MITHDLEGGYGAEFSDLLEKHDRSVAMARGWIPGDGRGRQRRRTTFRMISPEELKIAEIATIEAYQKLSPEQMRDYDRILGRYKDLKSGMTPYPFWKWNTFREVLKKTLGDEIANDLLDIGPDMSPEEIFGPEADPRVKLQRKQQILKSKQLLKTLLIGTADQGGHFPGEPEVVKGISEYLEEIAPEPATMERSKKQQEEAEAEAGLGRQGQRHEVTEDESR